MKTKILLLTLNLAAGLAWSSYAQTAATLVQQGRDFLAKQDITNANARFAAAVNASTYDPTANALYAASRILALPSNPAATQLLDKLGMSAQGRNLYHWTAQLPTDTNGDWLPPQDFDISSAVQFIRQVALPEISGALANLDKISDSTFLLTLSSNETSHGQVTIDYADIQLIKAMLHGFQFLGYTLNSYNWSAQLKMLDAMGKNDEINPENLLKRFPNALTYANTNDFLLAKTEFIYAVDAYRMASILIRTRPASQTRLFNWDPEMTDSELKFRQTATELKNSWDAPTPLTYATSGTNHITVYLAKFNDPAKPLRTFLPAFKRKTALVGTLPDPTFNGILPGRTLDEVENMLAKQNLLGGILSLPEKLANGRLKFQMNSLSDMAYPIFVSSDLRNWQYLTTATATNKSIVFEDPDGSQQPRRFYWVGHGYKIQTPTNPGGTNDFAPATGFNGYHCFTKAPSDFTPVFHKFENSQVFDNSATVGQPFTYVKLSSNQAKMLFSDSSYVLLNFQSVDSGTFQFVGQESNSGIFYGFKNSYPTPVPASLEGFSVTIQPSTIPAFVMSYSSGRYTSNASLGPTSGTYSYQVLDNIRALLTIEGQPHPLTLFYDSATSGFFETPSETGDMDTGIFKDLHR